MAIQKSGFYNLWGEDDSITSSLCTTFHYITCWRAASLGLVARDQRAASLARCEWAASLGRSRRCSGSSACLLACSPARRVLAVGCRWGEETKSE
nr:hypothetical protein Itr_chr06CG09330 [Ipomoea trifida]